jgi:hypothetical protein
MMPKFRSPREAVAAECLRLDLAEFSQSITRMATAFECLRLDCVEFALLMKSEKDVGRAAVAEEIHAVRFVR